jgi:cobalt-precorrin 5A hydrolase / precorrin-3B C17-methyltransferase
VKPVVFILGMSALPLAQQLKSELDGEIHTPDCVSGGDVAYAKSTAHLAELFREGRTIIGLCASGILIRSLAPHLNDKRSEPPIIAVAEDGSSVVPLLGGHHGANELASKIAAITDGHAAMTTASEVRFGFAFDEVLPGYSLSNCLQALPSPSSVIPAKAGTQSCHSGAATSNSLICNPGSRLLPG